MIEALHTLAEGRTLSSAQAERAMHLMLSGESQPESTAALLMGLRARGETLEELVAFTRIMRAFAVSVESPDENAIDLCGTGGDNRGTFNISTAAALVCAGAGAVVAKHGNRSVSSQCGSADVLEALGVRVDLHKEGVEYCLREVGIAFLFAPYFHPAMRHVMPVRKKLGVRTFFNILGPLSNPAGVRRQLVGAFSASVAAQMAHILAHLGADHVIAVHSDDGLDEISPAAPTRAFVYDGRRGAEGAPMVDEKTIAPDVLGLPAVPLDDLKGGSAADNAEIMRRLLSGEDVPHRHVVLQNAAYALHVAGKASSPQAGLQAARESVDSGAAAKVLGRLVDASQEAPAA